LGKTAFKQTVSVKSGYENVLISSCPANHAVW